MLGKVHNLYITLHVKDTNRKPGMYKEYLQSEINAEIIRTVKIFRPPLLKGYDINLDRTRINRWGSELVRVGS